MALSAIPRFELATAGRIVFGCGVADEVGALARDLGRHALLVSGRSSARGDRVRSLLSSAGMATTTWTVSHEPTLATIEEGVAAARTADCDLVVAVGGGSVLDSAKAVAALAASDAALLDHLEVIGGGAPLTYPSLPCIALPTTAGTGSEVTRNAVLASPEHRVKVSLRSPVMLPRLAIVDPELTFDLPPALTASTGLDALTQVIEPYVSRRANPVTDAWCVAGMRRAATALVRACHDGRDREAREQMSLTSLYGGLALANAALGAVHGFAGPIGGMFHAPHGAICAALLPHVVAGNIRALDARATDRTVRSRFDEIGRLLTGRPGADAEDGVRWLLALVAELQIPPLRHYGVTSDHVDAIVDQSTRASSMKGNPIDLTRDELAAILSAAI
jgi:alcohol dehydrogenase class IV